MVKIFVKPACIPALGWALTKLANSAIAVLWPELFPAFQRLGLINGVVSRSVTSELAEDAKIKKKP